MDEREIEAVPHEGCLERACECVQDEIASLRRLNQVLAPRYPMVNVPGDTLDAISKRAEDAEAALGRVRDARSDEEGCPKCGKPSVSPPAEVYCVDCATEGWERDAVAHRTARSPQGEDHERCGYGACVRPKGHTGSHSVALDGTPFSVPQGEDHEAGRLAKLADWLERDRREPDKVIAYAQEVRRLAVSPSRVGSVAVEDVLRYFDDRGMRLTAGEIRKAVLDLGSTASTGDREDGA
jgi:hypothetical protein